MSIESIARYLLFVRGTHSVVSAETPHEFDVWCARQWDGVVRHWIELDQPSFMRFVQQAEAWGKTSQKHPQRVWNMKLWVWWPAYRCVGLLLYFDINNPEQVARLCADLHGDGENYPDHGVDRWKRWFQRHFYREPCAEPSSAVRSEFALAPHEWDEDYWESMRDYMVLAETVRFIEEEATKKGYVPLVHVSRLAMVVRDVMDLQGSSFGNAIDLLSTTEHPKALVRRVQDIIRRVREWHHRPEIIPEVYHIDLRATRQSLYTDWNCVTALRFCKVNNTPIFMETALAPNNPRIRNLWEDFAAHTNIDCVRTWFFARAPYAPTRIYTMLRDFCDHMPRDLPRPAYLLQWDEAGVYLTMDSRWLHKLLGWVAVQDRLYDRDDVQQWADMGNRFIGSVCELGECRLTQWLYSYALLSGLGVDPEAGSVYPPWSLPGAMAPWLEKWCAWDRDAGLAPLRHDPALWDAFCRWLVLFLAPVDRPRQVRVLAEPFLRQTGHFPYSIPFGRPLNEAEAEMFWSWGLASGLAPALLVGCLEMPGDAWWEQDRQHLPDPLVSSTPPRSDAESDRDRPEVYAGCLHHQLYRLVFGLVCRPASHYASFLRDEGTSVYRAAADLRNEERLIHPTRFTLTLPNFPDLWAVLAPWPDTLVEASWWGAEILHLPQRRRSVSVLTDIDELERDLSRANPLRAVLGSWIPKICTVQSESPKSVSPLSPCFTPKRQRSAFSMELFT